MSVIGPERKRVRIPYSVQRLAAVRQRQGGPQSGQRFRAWLYADGVYVGTMPARGMSFTAALAEAGARSQVTNATEIIEVDALPWKAPTTLAEARRLAGFI